MGDRTFSKTLYTRSAKSVTDGGRSPATMRAEQQAKETGKLNPLVDPNGFGVIRRSLPRLEKRNSGLWELLVGPPLAIETRVDTTGSMGGNVDIALRVLPNMYEGCKAVAERYDLQIATGIFGDVQDNFVLCRPQFEMHADKIVVQLSLMVPERQGGDTPEDPHYGLFGAAYLTAAHIVKLGLKSYDFTVSDAPARDLLDEKQLRRIFGAEVFEKVAENGHKISTSDLPNTKEVVQDLLTRAHAFFLQVGKDRETQQFWKRVFPAERIVQIPSTEVLPQVQAAIIGLTEGSLDLGTCEQFLREQQVSAAHAKAIVRALAGIPLEAQAQLPNFLKLPKKGDLFESKDSLWPVTPEEAQTSEDEKDMKKKKKKGNQIDWL